MKKVVYYIAVCILSISCQKTITASKDNNNTEEQMAAIIKKYPNLSISSTGNTNGKSISVHTLKEFEDSVARLSKIALSIKLITDSAEIKRLDSVYGQSNKQSHLVSTAATDASGSAVYAWQATQYVGSSISGDYPIYYNAIFNYYTDSPTPINRITAVSGLHSSAPTATFEEPHSFGYYLYVFNYTPISSSYALNTENQIASLAFDGTVSVGCSYVVLGFSQVVSGYSQNITFNPSIFSSTFPHTIVY
ncbi:MAG TPA: hypothetical protein VFQ86_08110 [Arachidicoccus soli]|nr:hypothetical protein [Arachidicoccus soli]